MEKVEFEPVLWPVQIYRQMERAGQIVLNIIGEIGNVAKQSQN